MMIRKITRASVVLLILTLGAITAHAAQLWQCKGTYPGTVTRGAENTVVQIQEVDTSVLSSYSDVKPYTGGNRVFVYFDTNSATKGAEYCLFVYRDNWTLRKQTQPGFFGAEVGTGNIANLEANSTKGFVVEFKSSLIKGQINRCWNYHMQ